MGLVLLRHPAVCSVKMSLAGSGVVLWLHAVNVVTVLWCVLQPRNRWHSLCFALFPCVFLISQVGRPNVSTRTRRWMTVFYANPDTQGSYELSDRRRRAGMWFCWGRCLLHKDSFLAKDLQCLRAGQDSQPGSSEAAAKDLLAAPFCQQPDIPQLFQLNSAPRFNCSSSACFRSVLWTLHL